MRQSPRVCVYINELKRYETGRSGKRDDYHARGLHSLGSFLIITSAVFRFMTCASRHRLKSMAVTERYFQCRTWLLSIRYTHKHGTETHMVTWGARCVSVCAVLYLTRFMQHAAAYSLTFGVKAPEHNVESNSRWPGLLGRCVHPQNRPGCCWPWDDVHFGSWEWDCQACGRVIYTVRDWQWH